MFVENNENINFNDLNKHKIKHEQRASRKWEIHIYIKNKSAYFFIWMKCDGMSVHIFGNAFQHLNHNNASVCTETKTISNMYPSIWFTRHIWLKMWRTACAIKHSHSLVLDLRTYVHAIGIFLLYGNC